MTDAPNDPDRFDRGRYVVRDSGGMGTASIAAVTVACALLVTLVLYAMNRGDEPVTTASSPPAATGSPPATTGQSQTPEPKAESKGEPKAEPKSEQKADPKPDPKSEPKAK